MSECINSITGIIAALATLGMLGAAIFALHTWKNESIGTKKIDLAYEVMESVYDIQGVISTARFPSFLPSENQGILAWIENEKLKDPTNAIIAPLKFQYLVPQYRLNQSIDIIEKHYSLFNKASMYWDKEIMILFYKLAEYIRKIRHASLDLYYSTEPERLVDLISIIRSNNNNDEISKRINDIVDEFMLNLEPIYKDKKMKWKKLKKAKGDGNE